MPAMDLVCLFLPSSDPRQDTFQIAIDSNEFVDQLRALIVSRVPSLDLAHASKLRLWKCVIPKNNDLEVSLASVTLNPADALDPDALLVNIFTDTDFPRNSIHILVQNKAANKKRPIDAVNQGVLESWPSKRQKNTLPSLEELAGFLEEPLCDSDKIPITQHFFESLISSPRADKCTPDDIGNLFKIGEPDPDVSCLFAAIFNPAPKGGSKKSFIYFWDSNIRRPLELLIPTGKSIRYSNEHTLTEKLRPDYGFLLKNICSFRGEEKGPEDRGNPKAEMAEKLNWVYDDAPYVFGYYCSGTLMTLAAIIAPTGTTRRKPDVYDLYSIDLKLRKNRIANIRHLINLSTILPRLADLVRSPVDDFRIFTRENSRVEITSTMVVKTYTCLDAEEKVQYLRRVYKILADASVPNTDTLVLANRNVAHLSPRGIAVYPEVHKELRECLVCILESLAVAHRVPIYHCDIRWDNVIRKIGDKSKWLLIDWEDAAVPPTKARPTFSESNHSPAIFSDGHGAEVDIWAIGYLIETSRAIDISPDLKKLGERICEESESLSADEVLILVNNCP